jgi:large subunit ribosomal protein L10
MRPASAGRRREGGEDMLKTQKEMIVAELAERLRTADTLIVADYRGLTHAELDGVRTELLKHGARFSVCKNTLTRLAAQTAGVESLLELLTGPTAIAFVHDGDMVAVAKTLNDTARTTRRLELRGGVLQGRTIGADAVRDLASLPPADVLRGQVLGAIVAPLTSLVGLLGAPLTSLVGLIDARIDQLQSGTAADAPAPAGDAASAGEGEADAAPETEAAAGETTTEEETDEPAAPEQPATDGEEG